jgi:hypothetical protein
LSGEIKGGEVEYINDRRDGQNVVRLKEKNCLQIRTKTEKEEEKEGKKGRIEKTRRGTSTVTITSRGRD